MSTLTAEEKKEIQLRRGWIENQGEKIAPAFKIMILALICAIAVGVRVFSVIRYESVSLPFFSVLICLDYSRV